MASSEQQATGELTEYQGYALAYRLIKTASVFLICVCMVSLISRSICYNALYDLHRRHHMSIDAYKR